MDDYCDTLEAKGRDADREIAELQKRVNVNDAKVAEQAVRLHGLDDAEEMCQHYQQEMEGLKKLMDAKQVQYDRMSDEVGPLHEQIAHFKAQLTHFLSVQLELDELKRQFVAIEERGGTPGISIVRDASNETVGAAVGDDAVSSLKVGDRVELQSGSLGTVQYIGSVPPIPDEVIGVAMDEAIPNGHGGRGLFVCTPQHGHFVPREMIQRIVSNHKSPPRLKSDYKTVRILVTNVDDENSAAHRSQCDYVEPVVPLSMEDDLRKLGWILHRLRETPIGPLDESGSNKIDVQQFAMHFMRHFHDEDDSVYQYVFALIDLDCDGWITPLEHYRFFDEYRLFPGDHFVNGQVEFKVTAIKSYGLVATPVHSYVLPDGAQIYVHRTQFVHLRPLDHERDDTSDEEQDEEEAISTAQTPPTNNIYTTSSASRYHPKYKYLSPRISSMAEDHQSADGLSLDVDDDGTESPFEHDEAQNGQFLSVVTPDMSMAMVSSDEEEDTADGAADRLQNDIAVFSGSSSTTATPEVVGSSGSSTSVNGSVNGKYADFIQSDLRNTAGLTSQRRSTASSKKKVVLMLNSTDGTNGDDGHDDLGVMSPEDGIPRIRSIGDEEHFSTVSGTADKQTMVEMLKEYSRSKAELNLQRIGYEMGHEELKQRELELQSEREELEEERASLEEEREKWMKIKAEIESLQQCSFQSQQTPMLAITAEYEEDVVSLGLQSNFNMLGDSTIDMMSPFTPRSPLAMPPAMAAVDQMSVTRTEAQILRDKVGRLQQLLRHHDVEIPQDLMSIVVPGWTASTRRVHADEHRQRLLLKQPSVKIQESSNIYSEYGDADDGKVDMLETDDERQNRIAKERAERTSKINLERITSVREEEEIREETYSLGIQLLFDHYDIDRFHCVTFNGFMAALRDLELDDTPENELRAIFYWADSKGNGGLHIDEFVHALIAQFLNSILDRKLRLIFAQVDESFNGALEPSEMRMALEILHVEMSEAHLDAMYEAAQNAGVSAIDDNWRISVKPSMALQETTSSAVSADEESESEDDGDLVCDFIHWKYGLLTAQPFAVGDVELSDKIAGYDQEAPSEYVSSVLNLCWHVIHQSFKLMDEDHDGLLNSADTANVIDYLGITNKNVGDMQTLRGVFRKVCSEHNHHKHLIDFKVLLQVMIQQFFRGISDLCVRTVFDRHSEGLMSFEQFVASFQAISKRLPEQRGDRNFKNVACKEEGGLLKVFRSTDKLGTGTMEWNNYRVAVRECIHFHLEDNVKYNRIFGALWKTQLFTARHSQSGIYSPLSVVGSEHSLYPPQPSSMRDVAAGSPLEAVDYDKVIRCALQREFNKLSAHNVGDVVTVQQIVEMSDAHKWRVRGVGGFGGGSDSERVLFERWIGSLCGDGLVSSDVSALRIDWDQFQSIVYNIWYRLFIERAIEKQFAAMFPESGGDGDGGDDEEFTITVDELASFVENMSFGLNDALIRAEDKVLKMCYRRVDANGSGAISFDEMLSVLQHLALYAMAEWSLRYRFLVHGVDDDQNRQKFLFKEDFMAISKSGFLVFSNDDGLEEEDDSLLMVRVCNSTSFLSGLFDKFASTQYRGDTVSKMTFDAFSTAYFYRMLMELSCFYIDDLCALSFDEEEDDDGTSLTAEYEDYFPVLQTLGFVDDRSSTGNAVLCSQSTCDAMAVRMFGATKLSMKQFYVFLMNRAFVTNLELQIYGVFKEFCGDHRDYVTSKECVRLLLYLAENGFVHGTMYSMERYLTEYLKFWQNHFEVIQPKKRRKRKRAKSSSSADGHGAGIEIRARKQGAVGGGGVVVEDKWHFESFLHCLTFHQFQLNHGGSHLLLKAMHLDRQKMKMLKQSEQHIVKERVLLNKERKLHEFYTKMVNAMQRNQRELTQCKERIFSETKTFKGTVQLLEAAESPGGSRVPGLPTRTSALDLAKQALSGKSRRTSVLVRNMNPMGIVREDDGDEFTGNSSSESEARLDVPRQISAANNVSAELNIRYSNENLNIFGAADSISSENESDDRQGDEDIDI